MTQGSKKLSNRKMIDANEWPPRPLNEVFPELLTTLDTAMFLRYDARPGMTPEKATRQVRFLVKKKGLPTLRRSGRGYLFEKVAVVSWLQSADGPVDSGHLETRGACLAEPLSNN